MKAIFRKDLRTPWGEDVAVYTLHLSRGMVLSESEVLFFEQIPLYRYSFRLEGTAAETRLNLAMFAVAERKGLRCFFAVKPPFGDGLEVDEKVVFEAAEPLATILAGFGISISEEKVVLRSPSFLQRLFGGA